MVFSRKKADTFCTALIYIFTLMGRLPKLLGLEAVESKYYSLKMKARQCIPPLESSDHNFSTETHSIE